MLLRASFFHKLCPRQHNTAFLPLTYKYDTDLDMTGNETLQFYYILLTLLVENWMTVTCT